MDLTRAFERYIRHHRAEGSSPKTLQWHTYSLTQFIAHVHSTDHSGDIEDLAADDLRSFIDHLREKGLAQSSVATKVRSVKAWGKWLAEEEYIHRDPFARVKRPKVDDAARATLTPVEIDRLLAGCDRGRVVGARDFALMLLLFSTGLRAAEVLALEGEDVDPDRGVILVRRGKGGKFRVVPLGRAVEKALRKYLQHPRRRERGEDGPLFLTDDGQPLSMRGLQTMLKRRGAAAGVAVGPHKFRHSCAVEYLRGGGRVEVLRAMLGHSGLAMTLHYARIAGVDVASAHEAADPVRSLKARV